MTNAARRFYNNRMRAVSWILGALSIVFPAKAGVVYAWSNYLVAVVEDEPLSHWDVLQERSVLRYRGVHSDFAAARDAVIRRTVLLLEARRSAGVDRRHPEVREKMRLCLDGFAQLVPREAVLSAAYLERYCRQSAIVEVFLDRRMNALSGGEGRDAEGRIEKYVEQLMRDRRVRLLSNDDGTLKDTHRSGPPAGSGRH